MKAFIVDDEPPARREMRRLLAAFEWLEVVGESGTIDDAAARIDQLRPSLLFLDIQMPGGTGFDLLARLEHMPLVIFTTAYDDYAVRAFDVNALDYLLKPVDPVRLTAALNKVRTSDALPAPPAGAPLKRLFVRDGARCWFVPLSDVKLLVAEGNYVRLFSTTMKAQPLIGRSLATLEPRLDPELFFRANRGQIINLNCIESVELGVNGRLHVHLREGPEVEISRRQAQVFRARMAV